MFTKGNIRKNFLRVKQSADQKLGRVEKTEVLSDDLQSSEKRLELVKQVSTNTAKKLSGSLLVTGATDADKKLKKMPEAGLAHSMIESATILGTDNVMGQMYQMCGDCQNQLAKNHLEYEVELEQKVLEPVTDIVESEIPLINKLRKALTKVTLDMDSAKSRWHNAVRQTQVPGVNIASASAKADTIKDELEEAENRVEQAKDAYTTEIFNFISRETDHSANLVHLLEAQARYHQQALATIQKMLPKMQEIVSCSPVKPVYGTSLEEHLRVTNRDIAQVLEACVCYLLEAGLEEEGLFRIAGMASKVKKLKATFDAGVDLDDTGEMDSHTVAGALKQYLRELPEPLLTFAKYNDFVAAVQQPAGDQRLQALWVVVNSLPKPNYDNFRYLIKFLAKLSKRSDVNKMSPSNIAIVIGPNLIWPEGDSGPNMMNTGILSLITELVVQHADWFFPGAQDFHATQRDCAPEHKRTQRPLLAAGKPAIATNKPQGQKEPVNEIVSMTTASQQALTPVRSRKTSATNQACTAAFNAVISPISGQQQSSQDSSSSESASLSASLSDVAPGMKEYEDADTLERHDSVDQYLTARGDLGEQQWAFKKEMSEPPTPTTANTKRTNPIITFDPNDRHKYRKPSKKAPPPPKPRSGSIPDNLLEKPQQSQSPGPSSKNVHSDMYSTAFALQSLSDGGTWPKYLSHVRNIWDDKLQKNGSTDNGVTTPSLGQGSGKGQTRSDQEIAHASSNNRESYDSSAENRTSDIGSMASSDHPALERTTSNQSNQSFSSAGTPQSSPAANQDTGNHAPSPQTPPIQGSGSRSPSVSPAVSNLSLTGTPGAESEDSQPIMMRRLPRKPAPPPPERPDRPYSVAVSASVKYPANYQTWPRQAPPMEEAEVVLETSTEKHKTLPMSTSVTEQRHDRPNPPERVSSLPPGHQHSTDRPKIPPPVVPPTHKRSASTGAPVNVITGQMQTFSDSDTGSSPYLHAGSYGSHDTSLDYTGSSTSNVGNQGSVGHVPNTPPNNGNNQLLPADKLASSSLPRQSVSRPPRPLPPPPPPPEHHAIVEQTHL